MLSQNIMKKRWVYLATGVFAMLFSGVLYAWSILKVPFKENFGFGEDVLSLNFTLTMCFFCLGAFFGSLICKKIGVKITLIIAGLLVGAGFIATGMLTAESATWLLYITYAILAGSGIGISYNVVVSTVCSWFPDRKGFCSGCLMMGFGISTLLMGNAISILFGNEDFGVSKTYILLGIILAVVLVLAGIILRKPSADDKLPSPKANKSVKKEAFESRDFTTAEMLKSFTFWRAFACMAFITAVGNLSVCVDDGNFLSGFEVWFYHSFGIFVKGDHLDIILFLYAKKACQFRNHLISGHNAVGHTCSDHLFWHCNREIVDVVVECFDINTS